MFNKIKKSLEKNKKQEVADSFGLSLESVRLVGLSKSWRSWQIQATKRRNERKMVHSEYKLEYEDVPQKSNWFTSKMPKLFR